MKPSKSFEFTMFDVEEDLKLLTSWADEVSRLVVSKELCPKTGKEHLQGSVVFRRAYRLGQLKKLHPSAHWEPTRCTADKLYIMKKDSELLLNVNNRKQGNRSDLQTVVEDIKDGVQPYDLWKNHTATMIRYSRGILEASRIFGAKGSTTSYPPLRPLLDEWSRSIIIWGEPGVGKSQYALAHFKSALMVSNINDLKSFNKAIHDGIIFDDMSFTHMPREVQIHLVDQDFDRSIRVMYGIMTIPAHTKKIFTTNVCNGLIFLMDGAISRRVKVVEFLKAEVGDS